MLESNIIVLNSRQSANESCLNSQDSSNSLPCDKSIPPCVERSQVRHMVALSYCYLIPNGLLNCWNWTTTHRGGLPRIAYYHKYDQRRPTEHKPHCDEHQTDYRHIPQPNHKISFDLEVLRFHVRRGNRYLERNHLCNPSIKGRHSSTSKGVDILTGFWDEVLMIRRYEAWRGRSTK